MPCVNTSNIKLDKRLLMDLRSARRSVVPAQ